MNIHGLTLADEGASVSGHIDDGALGNLPYSLVHVTDFLGEFSNVLDGATFGDDLVADAFCPEAVGCEVAEEVLVNHGEFSSKDTEEIKIGVEKQLDHWPQLIQHQKHLKPTTHRRLYMLLVKGSVLSLFPKIWAVLAVGMGAIKRLLRIPCWAIFSFNSAQFHRSLGVTFHIMPTTLSADDSRRCQQQCYPAADNNAIRRCRQRYPSMPTTISADINATISRRQRQC